MYIRLSHNTKIYRTKEGGYVFNRKMHDHLFFNETGIEWLLAIGRELRNADEIVSSLILQYRIEDQQQIIDDFNDFIISLIRKGYLIESTNAIDVSEELYNLTDEEQTVFKTLPELTIEVTSKCNERCIHCYLPNQIKDKGKVLSLEKIQSIIDDLIELKGSSITFTGGEAMLHPKLKEIIRYAKHKGLEVSVLSNLTRLSNPIIEVLTEADNSKVQVSLYAITDEIHDTITKKKGSCKKTKDAIEKLAKMGIEVTLSMAVMKENYKDVVNVISYADKHNLKLQFDYVLLAQSNLDSSNLNHRMSLEETEDFFRLLMNYNVDFGKKILKKHDYNANEGLEDSLCYIANDGCCISSEGNVYPCPSWQDYALGNIMEQSLIDIWQCSSRLVELRDVKVKNLKECSVCPVRNFCCICLARNYNENNGDYKKLSKHACDVAYLSQRIYEEYQNT